MAIACKKQFLFLVILGTLGLYVKDLGAMRWCCGAAAVAPEPKKTSSVEFSGLGASSIDEVIAKEMSRLATKLLEDPDSAGLPRFFIGVPGVVKHEASLPTFLRRVSTYVMRYDSTGYISRHYGRLLQPAIVIDDFEKVCAIKGGETLLSVLYNVVSRAGCCQWFFLVKKHMKDIDLDFFKKKLAEITVAVATDGTLYLQRADIVYLPDDISLDDASKLRHWRADLMEAFQRDYWFWLLRWKGQKEVLIDDYP